MKISIITPCFQTGPYLRRAIDSVLSQRGDFELEYLVFDGGSTDETIEILQSYGDRVRWWSEKDRGQSDAINKGMRIASGDVIAYLNADDVYTPGALAAVASFFSSSSARWAFGRCEIIDEDDKRIQPWITAYKNFFLSRYSYQRLLAENFVSQPATFWRRDIVEEFGYFDESEHLVMDYEYWLRIGAHCQPGYIDRTLALFRWQAQSKSRTSYDKTFADGLRVAKRYGRGWPIYLHEFNRLKIVAAYDLIERVRAKMR